MKKREIEKLKGLRLAKQLITIAEFKAHYNEKAIKKSKRKKFEDKKHKSFQQILRKSKQGGFTKYNTPATKAEKVITCKCNSGHIHNSRDEKRYCDILLLRLKANDIQSYRVERKYEIKVNGTHICNMFVDFEVITNESNLEIHEYKGFPTADWKLKEKLFRAVYPDIPYIVKRQGDLI